MHNNNKLLKCVFKVDNVFIKSVELIVKLTKYNADLNKEDKAALNKNSQIIKINHFPINIIYS